ncbi:MAG: glycosyltransferase family 2 protein [Lachnospiraceae bacterium]|nr:glycosyltransferase family 2 protein [Lachnospiraceae bacterium]
MTFELLVSCVKKDPHELAAQMNIASDAVIVSQLEEKDSEETFELAGNMVRAIKSTTRGVGLNRNICIENSTADIILFADEDIVYEKEYAYTVMREFDAHPEADMLLFNVKVCDERRTYWNEDFHAVKWYNCGRYPAYSIAARGSALKMSGVKFSLLFGGGAKYSNGEDSLFLNDCLKKGLKIFATPVCIGEEIPRPSTWFKGYTDKFFYDRGVLYHFLYGGTAKLWGIRWLLKMKPQYSDEITYKEAKKLLFMGIADGDDVDREFSEEGILL